MKYSKNKQKIHFKWVWDIMVNHPRPSSRKIQEILDNQGKHLSRNYILKIMDKTWQDMLFQVGVDSPEVKQGVGAWIVKFEALEYEYRRKFGSLLKRFVKAIKKWEKNKGVYGF